MRTTLSPMQRNLVFDIRYAKISDGFPLSFDRRAPAIQFMEGLTHVFQAHVDDFIENLVFSKPNRPISCIIADSFHIWGSMIAKKYNLINVSFWTEPATVLTVFYHTDLLKSNGHFGCHDKYEDTIRYIPGIQAIKPEDLPSYCQDADPNDSNYVFKCIEDAQKADFFFFLELGNFAQKADLVIGNTVQELVFNHLGVPRAAAILCNWVNLSHKLHQENNFNEPATGYSGNSTRHSDKFWVLHHNIFVSGEQNTLPLGFEEETADRGLVVLWCSQLAVLSHPAVGGFSTHSGWNSVLESILCEVPTICFPVMADQLTNRKLVVNDWRIGVNLCTGRLIRRE
ncbi:putative DNA-binding protein ESCAROLA-like [Capsicum annuum]|nr:putative DNA-binding protein ESCAROLA-like [Capsicum annuum]KAF3653470.1 putative DNA-binding protein ESCAROLA-like [Capsicum annuum]